MPRSEALPALYHEAERELNFPSSTEAGGDGTDDEHLTTGPSPSSPSARTDLSQRARADEPGPGEVVELEMSLMGGSGSGAAAAFDATSNGNRFSGGLGVAVPVLTVLVLALAATNVYLLGRVDGRVDDLRDEIHAVTDSHAFVDEARLRASLDAVKTELHKDIATDRDKDRQQWEAALHHTQVQLRDLNASVTQLQRSTSNLRKGVDAQATELTSFEGSTNRSLSQLEQEISAGCDRKPEPNRQNCPNVVNVWNETRLPCKVPSPTDFEYPSTYSVQPMLASVGFTPAADRWSEGRDDLSALGNYKYWGGVLLPDGRVVLVPHNAAHVGLYDAGGTRNGFAYSVAAISDAVNVLLLPYYNKF